MQNYTANHGGIPKLFYFFRRVPEGFYEKCYHTIARYEKKGEHVYCS